MKAFWDERYKNEAYAYGETPNVFLREKLMHLQHGTILFPAEGEGRNAVFAAQLGWKVFAFDISEEGKIKAEKLAKKHQVAIDYFVGEISGIKFPEQQFDAIASIYAHFPADVRSQYHQYYAKYLKSGGLIILEAFSKAHIEYQTKNEKVGGPKDINLLYSIEEIEADFKDFEILELTEKAVTLNEGLFHNGLGSVVRFVGKKI